MSCLPLSLDLFERLSANENAISEGQTLEGNDSYYADVGLTSSGERLKEEYKIVIKYTIEIEGLPIYTENYDAAKLRKEVEADEQTLREDWFRRVKVLLAAVTGEAFLPV